MQRQHRRSAMHAARAVAGRPGERLLLELIGTPIASPMSRCRTCGDVETNRSPRQSTTGPSSICSFGWQTLSAVTPGPATTPRACRPCRARVSKLRSAETFSGNSAAVDPHLARLPVHRRHTSSFSPPASQRPPTLCDHRLMTLKAMHNADRPNKTDPLQGVRSIATVKLA